VRKEEREREELRIRLGWNFYRKDGTGIGLLIVKAFYKNRKTKVRFNHSAVPLAFNYYVLSLSFGFPFAFDLFFL
jgi:hypothetical protein